MHLIRPVIRTILFLLVPFSCTFALFNTNDTTRTPLQVPRINSDIKIDAVLDEPYWQDALVIETNIEVRPGKHLNLEMGHTWEKLDVAPGRLYTANSSKFKVIYQFSKRIFVRAILQKMVYDCNVSLYKDDDVDPKEKTFFNQFLFSYKINPQTVLFLGYSDNYWGDHVDPLTRTDRVFFAKMGYAWRI